MAHFSNTPRLAWLLSLVAALAGCGSDEKTEQQNPPTNVDLDDPGLDGWQLQTGLIAVPPGEEVQNCYFFEVPFDRPVFVNRITLAQNAGSHHLNVFRMKTIKALDGAPGQTVQGGECWKSPNWSDWPIIANSQNTGVEDWNLPEGVALKFEPREKIMLQSHYVNATTQKTPSDGKVVVNFHGLPEGSEAMELGTVFATNQQIEICPGTDRSFSATCGLSTDAAVTVVAASGHFHSRGKRFTMDTFSSLTGEGEQFYESRSWDEPPFLKNLDVKIPALDGIRWTCEFSVRNDECGDPNNNCCFTFGGFVEYQEHCNAFVYYYPKTKGSTDRNCF
jgi:hypothetical protein